VIAALVLIGMTGCGGSRSGSGGSSSQNAANEAPSASVAPLTLGGGAAAGPGIATARYGVRASQAHDKLSVATKASQAPSRAFYQRSVRTTDSEESTPSTQRIINPCALVTRPEAAAAMGVRILKVTKAPLGPTCIFQGAGDRVFASVAVQVRPFARLVSQDRSLRRFAGLKRSAYCGGTRSATVLFVRVGADEVLQVTAPCQTAAKIAAHAMARLRAARGVPVTQP
jgi:hypothetical protein